MFENFYPYSNTTCRIQYVLTFLCLSLLQSLSKYFWISSSSSEVFLSNKRPKLSSGIVGIPLEYSIKWAELRKSNCSCSLPLKEKKCQSFALQTKPPPKMKHYNTHGLRMPEIPFSRISISQGKMHSHPLTGDRLPLPVHMSNPLI